MIHIRIPKRISQLLKLTIRLIPLSVLVIGCSSSGQEFQISNRFQQAWDYHEVIISREQLSTVDSKVPVVYDSSNEIIASQVDDLDNDGSWDELVFQISISGEQTDSFEIQWVEEAEYPTFKKLTQVYLGYSADRDNQFVSLNESQRPDGHIPQKYPYTYQYEGPGWESNLVAYRSYFDSRNGKDIFGKTTDDMVTHNIGKGQNYHELREWGMDVLKVGSSLGAGALAILKNDSLIRLGATKTASFNKLIEGPVRSILELKYQGWDVDGQEYELSETITIWANKRWYKSVVSLNPSLGDTLVTGIVNLKKPFVEQFDHSAFEILMSHGDQSENSDALGMAILVPEKANDGVFKAPTSGDGITNTDLVKLKPESGQYVFYFYSGWELENEIFSDKGRFKNQLKYTAQELSGILEVVL